MVRFLLDTNILSEPLRPQPNLAVMQRLTDQSAELSTASVVYHEMLFGYRRLPESRKRQVIAAYLQSAFEAARRTLATLKSFKINDGPFGQRLLAKKLAYVGCG